MDHIDHTVFFPNGDSVGIQSLGGERRQQNACYVGEFLKSRWNLAGALLELCWNSAGILWNLLETGETLLELPESR
jgi:hypothetical protein